MVDRIKEISKIVSRMKNKNSAELDKVFSKMVKQGLEYSKEKVEDVHTNVEKRQGHYVSAALFIITCTCQGISIHYLR